MISVVVRAIEQSRTQQHSSNGKSAKCTRQINATHKCTVPISLSRDTITCTPPLVHTAGRRAHDKALARPIEDGSTLKRMVVASPTDPACAPPGHSPEAHIRALPSTPLTPKSTTENKTKEQKPHHSTRGRAWEDRGHQSRKVNDTFITNASGRSQVCCASCSANSVCVGGGDREREGRGAKGHIGRAGAEGKSVERGCAVMVTAPCTAIDHSRKVSFYPTVKMFIIDVRLGQLGRGGAGQAARQTSRRGGQARQSRSQKLCHPRAPRAHQVKQNA